MSARRAARRASRAPTGEHINGVPVPAELRDPDAPIWTAPKAEFVAYMVARGWTPPARDRLAGPQHGSPGNRRQAAARGFAADAEVFIPGTRTPHVAELRRLGLV
ncbi:hypothetical protein ACFS2C_06690 [Prauserella oleivorans]|uniref:Uncharacterized protein n=1 Tax=Prauserella oleivorans TaxID=1478153 RepID=A0ABW5W9C6_9PSEU